MTSSHKRGGGSQKVTNDDEGGEGVSIPPKNDDVIYEQPLRVVDSHSAFRGSRHGSENP